MRYRFESWELDWSNRALKCDGSAVDVQPKVLQFLRFMLENRERLVTRQELTRELWSDVAVGPDALARVVKEARRVIRDSGSEPRLLLTRRGFGYQFAAKVEVHSEKGRLERVRPSLELPADESQQTTRVEQGALQSALTIHWLLPCRRLTPIKRATKVTFGRSSGCEEVLDGLGTSRAHAECFYQGPVAVIRDLGSRNGTYLNGLLVGQAPIVPNDVVRIGGWVGTVQSVACTGGARPEQVTPGFYSTKALLRLIGQAHSADKLNPIINIWGESGCGKNAMAAAIHHLGAANQPCITIQCKRGRELGLRSRFGTEIASDEAEPVSSILERCKLGTLVLDNIEELGARRWPWLTEVMRSHEDNAPRDHRLITTSRVSLPTLMKEGALPSAFFPVLVGVDLAIPALRHQRGEILGLVGAFLEELLGCARPSVSTLAAESLLLHPWPMNMTELRRAIRSLATTCGRKGQIELSDLPPEFGIPRTGPDSSMVRQTAGGK